MKSENKCPVDMLSNLKCNHFMGWLYLRRAISNVVRLSFSLCRIENLLLIPFISSETVWSKNPRVYFVVLMSVCPSIFTTDSIEILLASATVANVCLAIKWCYKINFELCKKRKGLQDWRPSLVIRLGFEPRTPSLKGMCSTCWASESFCVLLL